MKTNITYPEAKALFDKYLRTEYLRYHSRETEVIMRSLAKHLGEDEEFWGITGLLHDLDLDEIGEDMYYNCLFHLPEAMSPAPYMSRNNLNNLPDLYYQSHFVQ